MSNFLLPVFAAVADLHNEKGDLCGYLNSLAAVPQMQFDALRGVISCVQVLTRSNASLENVVLDADAEKFLRESESVKVARMQLFYSTRDVAAISKYATAMVSLMFAHQDKTFTMSVAVEPAKPAEPVEVVVVGMPERITESVITHNADGDIASVSQVERDV